MVQVGATDSEDEADTAEDLQRIEAAAAAISRRMQQTSPTGDPEEVQVTSLFDSHGTNTVTTLFWSADADIGHMGDIF